MFDGTWRFLHIPLISTVLHVDLLALHWLTGCNSERTIQVSNISHVVLKVPPLSSIKGWLLPALLDPGLVAVAILLVILNIGLWVCSMFGMSSLSSLPYAQPT